jgi:predicted transcriptional regulator
MAETTTRNTSDEISVTPGMLAIIVKIFEDLVETGNIEPADIPSKMAKAILRAQTEMPDPLVHLEPIEHEHSPFMDPEAAITDDAICCLFDGHKRTQLDRHLLSAHAMNPDQYRKWFGLRDDYPMIAKDHEARVSEQRRRY